ncbi:hypothetical protein Pint_01965 [Pistacia integerrima]|uniref:Uncharacterized protein n=1 Tax=Pistacia integerrima TaxID=434235 RepID=A0ACC0ZJF2_9ROSI|nr:hypothetical protein Pint_01965 [Pistacia integerrima]
MLSAAVGLSFLQFTNMNCMRNLIITGLSLFLGISVPQFFSEYWNPEHQGLVHTNAGWFNAFLNTIFSSPAMVGLIVAVFLDNTLELILMQTSDANPFFNSSNFLVPFQITHTAEHGRPRGPDQSTNPRKTNPVEETKSEGSWLVDGTLSGPPEVTAAV